MAKEGVKLLPQIQAILRNRMAPSRELARLVPSPKRILTHAKDPRRVGNRQLVAQLGHSRAYQTGHGSIMHREPRSVQSVEAPVWPRN